MGACPLFTSVCKYTPMPAKPHKTRQNKLPRIKTPLNRFTCPDRHCIAYDGYCRGSCPYFDSEQGCLHNR